MKNDLNAEEIQAWLDGEWQGPNLSRVISINPVLLKKVQTERHLRVVIGRAFTLEKQSANRPLTHHATAAELANYLEERLSAPAMHRVTKHLIECERCFTCYQQLYLHINDDFVAEPLPQYLRDNLIAKLTPPPSNPEGWLGRLMIGFGGGMEWFTDQVTNVQEYLRAEQYIAQLDISLESPEKLRSITKFSNRQKSPVRTTIQLGELQLTVTGGQEGNMQALGIQVINLDNNRPVEGLEITTIYPSGRNSSSTTDKSGQVYLLFPAGKSQITVGFRGCFDVYVD
jgi:hypothetical protein